MLLRSMSISAALAAVFAAAARADVKPHALCADGLVLQQQSKARVWGTADPGEKVTVKFRGAETSATAGQDGRWVVQIDSGAAGGPFGMTIAGKNTLEYKNVMVGEVWVCSGQSNMEWSVNSGSASDKETAKGAAPNSNLRMFTVKKNPQAAPVYDCAGSWVEAAPNTVGSFSAVGYFFGRDLNKSLNVPIGLIHTSWGGTRAEAWTSAKVLSADPTYKGEVEKFRKAVDRYKSDPDGLLKEQIEAARKAKKAEPKAATNPAGNPNAPSVLYNGMIAPVLPYTIKGAIWYQGESNAGRAFLYRTLMPTMIKNWRDDWGVGEFPFYMVQLASFQRITDAPVESAWAELREAQLLTAQKFPNCGTAVITDLGHESDIHPTPKMPVGERLALLARAMTYKQDIVHYGPMYSGMKVDGNKAVLNFNHVGGGLQTREWVDDDVRKNGKALRAAPAGGNARLLGFTVAGDDFVFVNAEAKIEGNTVVVWSDKVAKPAAVRYGWANYPVGNLFNKEGLPATPFRTDDRPGVTWPKQ
jgi:sialate O-acetylesterase